MRMRTRSCSARDHSVVERSYGSVEERGVGCLADCCFIDPCKMFAPHSNNLIATNACNLPSCGTCSRVSNHVFVIDSARALRAAMHPMEASRFCRLHIVGLTGLTRKPQIIRGHLLRGALLGYIFAFSFESRSCSIGWLYVREIALRRCKVPVCSPYGQTTRKRVLAIQIPLLIHYLETCAFHSLMANTSAAGQAPASWHPPLWLHQPAMTIRGSQKVLRTMWLTKLCCTDPQRSAQVLGVRCCYATPARIHALTVVVHQRAPVRNFGDRSNNRTSLLAVAPVCGLAGKYLPPANTAFSTGVAGASSLISLWRCMSATGTGYSSRTNVGCYSRHHQLARNPLLFITLDHFPALSCWIVEQLSNLYLRSKKPALQRQAHKKTCTQVKPISWQSLNRDAMGNIDTASFDFDATQRDQRSIRSAVGEYSRMLLGTRVANDTPLVDAGLDSLASTELVQQLSERMGLKLPATLLFDTPATRTISKNVSRHFTPACYEAHAVDAVPMRHRSQQSGLCNDAERRQHERSIGNAVGEYSRQLLGSQAAKDTPLMDAGFDSLTSTELVKQLSERLGLELSVTLLFDAPATRAISKTASRYLTPACHRSRAVEAIKANAKVAEIKPCSPLQFCIVLNKHTTFLLWLISILAASSETSTSTFGPSMIYAFRVTLEHSRLLAAIRRVAPFFVRACGRLKGRVLVLDVPIVTRQQRDLVMADLDTRPKALYQFVSILDPHRVCSGQNSLCNLVITELRDGCLVGITTCHVFVDGLSEVDFLRTLAAEYSRPLSRIMQLLKSNFQYSRSIEYQQKHHLLGSIPWPVLLVGAALLISATYMQCMWNLDHTCNNSNIDSSVCCDCKPPDPGFCQSQGASRRYDPDDGSRTSTDLWLSRPGFFCHPKIFGVPMGTIRMMN